MFCSFTTPECCLSLEEFKQKVQEYASTRVRCMRVFDSVSCREKSADRHVVTCQQKLIFWIDVTSAGVGDAEDSYCRIGKAVNTYIAVEQERLDTLMNVYRSVCRPSGSLRRRR